MKEFDLNNIFTDVSITGNKNDALKKMAELFAHENGIDAKALVQGFEAREKESTTGFGNGVAIPHAKINGLQQPVVGIVTFTQPIEWESLDEEPVEIAIALIMPLDDPNKEHLTVLSKLARKLMDDEFIKDLQNGRHDAKKLYEVVTNAIEFKA
ncbi:PTS sugar transporter subunit IIA [Pediococcus ethanolidurans]|uniref:PTS system, nitrogen regulatory IIA component n=1 Tax=Pediococcus ethanolidurans TaxID=319653 RepID=A0A0R2KAL4_9LACO|nr:PTS sugar transporter subunit IIA [Pediococcus ethanolidurans]KRN83543.1 phosphoenolpyruvate-dependent sugar phosphotransferase system, EIIA 2 family protein [Pediococcus ethanolidurans]GEN94102.1 PTS fructose transporter subunit IIA [Pediococcus ethanolidurans]SER05217.1 PTS system, nitrogen regulatory IIA component [Pediococcus ethanolidurans]